MGISFLQVGQFSLKILNLTPYFCDYSDAYILVKGTIAIETGPAALKAGERDK